MATIAEQAEILRQSYEAWAVKNFSGTAVIAPSLDDLWTIGFMENDRPNVVVCYVGDEARGPFETAAATHRGDVTFHVGLFRGKGFEADRGQSLVTDSGNAKAFLDQLEDARDIARALTNISVEKFVDYKATRPLEAVTDKWGKLILGYVIELSNAMDYPQLTDTPPDTLPQ
jgi:hypothetical protein